MKSSTAATAEMKFIGMAKQAEEAKVSNGCKGGGGHLETSQRQSKHAGDLWVLGMEAAADDSDNEQRQCFLIRAGGAL